MKLKEFNRLGQFTALVTSLAACLVLGTGAYAQDSAQIRVQYPELAQLFDAIELTQMTAVEQIAAINNDPSTQQERLEFAMHMTMMADMDDHSMHGGGQMQMNDDGHFGETEVNARVTLMEQLRSAHSADELTAAYAGEGAINRHTSEVFRRGNEFYRTLFSIYIDNSVRDKQAAVTAAVEEYLSDERHSVASAPKNSSYLLEHPQANALAMGYPLIRGFLWSNLWLELAALEAVILESLDDNVSDGIATVTERYWNKIGSAGGMTMFPAPVELPMVPAIAPNLYSQSPEAAYILDNLAILRTMVTDIQGFPFVENREELTDQVVAEFTNKEANLIQPMDYLYFALRGGIYNQGGPATGELMASERNRSRSAMNMQHTMIMSSPQ